MAIKIYTDSGCDLPNRYLKDSGIHVVPLHVTFQEATYLDRVNLEIDQFYLKMKEQEQLPKTAAPSPYEFLQLFEKTLGPNDKGIVISLSSALSSTFNYATSAVNMYKDEHPDRRLEAIDSKNASIGIGIIITHLVSLIKTGKSYDQVVNEIKMIIDNTNTLIFLDSLENVIKGGRLDRVKGTIASVLSIKILMKNSFEGSLDVVEKVRGSKKAMNRLVELVEEYGENLEQKILGIAHTNCEDLAISVKEMVEKKYKVSKIILTEIGPTIGTYAGERGILISF